MSFDSALVDAPSPALEGLQYAEMVSHSETPPLLTVGHLTSEDVSTDRVPNFGLSGEMQINFRLAKLSPEDELDYKFLVELQQGENRSRITTFPVTSGSGSCVCGPPTVDRA